MNYNRVTLPMPRSIEYMELKIFLEDRERWYRIKTGQEPKYNAMDAFCDHYRWYLLICPPLGIAILLYLYFTVKAKIKTESVAVEREKSESKPYENEKINTATDNAEKEILRAMLVRFVDSFDDSKVRIRNGLAIMLIDDVCSEFSNDTVQSMINYSLITVIDRKYLTINLRPENAERDQIDRAKKHLKHIIENYPHITFHNRHSKIFISHCGLKEHFIESDIQLLIDNSVLVRIDRFPNHFIVAL